MIAATIISSTKLNPDDRVRTIPSLCLFSLPKGGEDPARLWRWFIMSLVFAMQHRLNRKWHQVNLSNAMCDRLGSKLPYQSAPTRRALSPPHYRRPIPPGDTVSALRLET